MTFLGKVFTPVLLHSDLSWLHLLKIHHLYYLYHWFEYEGKHHIKLFLFSLNSGINFRIILTSYEFLALQSRYVTILSNSANKLSYR